MADLRHINHWVFDLDNTLYSAATNVFAEMDDRMATFVAGFLGVDMNQAKQLQKKYYAEHGTTLKGMMVEHGMAPDGFLYHVHEVDLSPLSPCQRLSTSLSALPGRKYIYTNGSRRHAERVTRQLGIDHLFDGLSGIEDAAYTPKPDRRAYHSFCDLHGVEPREAIFFEDMSRNLEPAHQMGFTTVLVQSDHDWSHEPGAARPAAIGDAAGDHVHYVTTDLADFLANAQTQQDQD